MKKTTQSIQDKKESNQKITMLTAYDYPTGKLLDESGVDMILVGDSVANVVLGLDSTTSMTMDQMIYHAQAVRRGVTNAVLVGDMPYESYQVNTQMSVSNAKRFVEEAGCDAIKLEWFDDCIAVTKSIVEEGIAVMGHVGLTPQTAEQLGGMKVQGKDAISAREIIKQARALKEAGCFSVVLECIPDLLAKRITEQISIPTIGIGAGVDCDGQVLVTHDMLGLFDRYHPKFVKSYVDLSSAIKSGVKEYCDEVSKGAFPSTGQSFTMSPEEFNKL
ncbi:MAG: 3-methyl-2-oxobutanoate hydroxymethyltransferase [Lysobacterales bacterium]|jgi:3-methyl-2-oxobutanoate hydroxymethyltransferase